jgi:hypothetical protein
MPSFRTVIINVAQHIFPAMTAIPPMKTCLRDCAVDHCTRNRRISHPRIRLLYHPLRRWNVVKCRKVLCTFATI